MASRFGGVPLEGEQVTASRFGGVPISEQPQKENLIARLGSSQLGQSIGQSIDKTGQIISNIPNMNPAAAGVQILGEGAKIAYAPLGAAIGEAFQYLPESAKNTIGEAMEGVRSAYKSGVNSLNETSIGQSIGDYLMNSPALQANMQEASDTAKSAGLIATSLPLSRAMAPITKKAIGAAENAAAKFEGATAKAPGILGDTRSGNIKPSNITPLERQSATKNAYAAAAQNKDVFPDIGNEYTAIIEKVKAKPLPSGKLTMEDRILNNHLDDFSGLEGKALGIDDINRIDKSLGQKITSAFNQNDKALATRLMDVQDDFRDALKGTKAGETLSDARALAANNFRAADIEEILLNAKNYDNPATYIKGQIRNIVQNTRRLNSYPKEAQLILKKIAEGGIAGDLLGQLGSRLGAIIGGATGGIGGAATGAAIGLAGRGAKTALYASRAEKALNANNAAIGPLVQKYKMQAAPVADTPVVSKTIPVITKGADKAAAEAEFLAKKASPKTTKEIPVSAGAQWREGLNPKTARDLQSPSSYVVRNKETGEVMREIAPELVKNLNTAKYEAVPIIEHLVNLNGQSYAKNGLSDTAKKVYDAFRKNKK